MMSQVTETLLILVVLVDLVALASSRLGALIRIVALQGILLGVIPLVADPADLTLRSALLAAVSLCLKGLIFPNLLLRATRQEAVRREVRPYVGYSLSLLVGAV